MKPKIFTFSIYRNLHKQYGLRVIVSNGQIIATFGETYTKRAHAVKMARKIGQMDLIQELRNSLEQMITGWDVFDHDEIKQLIGGMVAAIDSQSAKIEVEK